MTLADDRDRMVSEQLARRGIRDARVLDAMRREPREAFVPEEHRSRAYADQALPIGEGQTISQPYMVAIMTEALALRGGERVLEIGTGSGYQAAILSELAREVISIERQPELAARAATLLASLGYRNVQVLVGDGSSGHEAGTPYDAILVTAASPRIPDVLKSQLTDGGRLVIPVGPRAHQELTVVQRIGDSYTETLGESCVFVPLVGREAWPD